MRNLYCVFACLALVSLLPHGGLAHEPRGDFSPQLAVERGAKQVPSLACGEGCAIAQMPVALRKQGAAFAPPPEIVAAIAAASAATGANFVYLVKAAYLESSYDPAREVSTSSARGLFQFVEGTWLYMMREHGAAAGLREFADAVTYDEKEGFDVEDEILRAHILSLRYDAELSALFAAEFTHRNAAALARALGREADPAELYLAHVLGASGAAELIRLAQEKPGANACKVFARAAKANRTIFYDGKKPRTAEAVLNVLLNKFFDIPAGTGGVGLWKPGVEGGDVSLPVRYLGEHELIHAMRQAARTA